MEPFDAGVGDRSSSDRLDRLRARTASTTPPRAERAVFPWILSAVLLAFALGLIANPWFEQRVRSQLPGFAAASAPADAAAVGQHAMLTALQARVAALESRPAAAPLGIAAVPSDAAERMARAEARLEGLERVDPATTTRLDKVAADVAALAGRVEASGAASQATLASASASAEQAQRLLVLLAARRTIEAGTRLGALEPALRRQFALDYPQPVEAIAALGAAPMTLAALRSGFDRLRPDVGAPQPGSDRSWWGSLTDTLATVVQLRQTPDPANGIDPDSRMVRAAAALRSGDVPLAVEQVSALPPVPRARAAAWLAAALRYTAGMRALATLEAAALAAPPPAPMPTLVAATTTSPP